MATLKPRRLVGRRACRAAAARGRALAILAVLGVGLAASPVQADRAPLDLNRFHLALGTEKILTTDLATVGPSWQLVPQLVLHYADAPLVLTMGDEYQGDLVRNRITGELGVSLSLRDRVQLGVRVPITMFQAGGALELPPLEDGTGGNPPTEIAGAGLEDMRLSLKGLLWTDGRMGLGASGQLALPTGDTDSYLGSSSPRFDVRLLGHYRTGRVVTGINLGWLFAATEQVLLTRTGMALLFGAGVQYEVYQRQDTTVALAAEVFGLAHSRFESMRETPVELVLAAKTHHRMWSFFVGAGPGLTVGYGEPNVRVVAGASFQWRPAPKDQRLVTAPEPPAKDTPVDLTETPVEPAEPTDGWVDSTMTLPSDVFFEYDRCAITPGSYGELRKVADSLRDHPEWGAIRVEGHASNEGNERDEYNLRLSRCRAARIVRFLSFHGVDESRLSYLGFGYRCPKEGNETEASRSKNRRVEFVRDPEANPPRCPVPPQLEPLPKHAAEPEPYRTQGSQPSRPAPPATPAGSN